MNQANSSTTNSQCNKLKLSDGFFRSFASHPASVGETYLGHFLFALRFSSRLLAAGLAALIHAIVPAWFETTASRMVIAMGDELKSRHSPEQE